MQTEIKKSGRGGARKGAGAKPKKDKKEPLFLYVRQSVIKGNGGRDKSRTKAEGFLESQSKFKDDK